MGASALVAVALLAAGRLINAWLFGLLLLVAWALLTYGLRAFVLKRSRQLVVSLTALVLVFVVWNYTAKQPRIAVEGVQLRKLPSTVQPGLVEIVVRNDGGVAADISVLPVGELAPLYRNARDLVAANVEGDLRGLMKKAAPRPRTGTTRVAVGERIVINVEVPFSERAWYFQRGELTLLVTARVRYRDRVFQREKVFCQFTTPQSGSWMSCPFLNN